MSDDFKQTVDLSEKLARKDKEVSEPKKSKKIIRKKRLKRRAEGIDRVFDDDEDVKVQPNMQMIDRPALRKQQSDSDFFKKTTVVLAISLVLVLAYFLFFKSTPANDIGVENLGDTGWYSVKLTNNEMYYGQIYDLSSDPVIIRNVYYNYDQINKEEGEKTTAEESGNLRLVKRGKETHGGDGTLSIVRAQVVLMEPLKEDSKVLKAILDYEK